MQTVFATNWRKNSFRRVKSVQRASFQRSGAVALDASIPEVFSTPEMLPIGADGVLAGARYFTYNMYPLEILQSSVNPELLFVLPLLGPGLGALNSSTLLWISPAGNKRFVTLRAKGSPCSGETRRSCSCRTLSRVTGASHRGQCAHNACSRPYDSCLSAPSFHFHSNSNQSRKRVARAGAGYSRNVFRSSV